MTKYKVVFDGVEEDEIFDTESDAQDHADYLCSCCKEGAETLNMSNPGDWEYDEDDWEEPDYEIIEVEVDDD